MEMTLRKYALHGLAGAALGAVLLVGGCAMPGNTGPTPAQVALAQAWAQALDTSADAVIASQLAAPTTPAATKVQLQTWQAGLDSAVKAFTSAGPTNLATLPTLAAQVASAGETIAAGLPNLTPGEKAGVLTSLAIVQAFAANLTVPTTAPPASLIAHQ